MLTTATSEYHLDTVSKAVKGFLFGSICKHLLLLSGTCSQSQCILLQKNHYVIETVFSDNMHKCIVHPT